MPELDNPIDLYNELFYFLRSSTGFLQVLQILRFPPDLYPTDFACVPMSVEQQKTTRAHRHLAIETRDLHTADSRNHEGFSGGL